MNQYKAKHFNAFFPAIIDSVKKAHPQINSITVLGFCFGGSLALYSGIFNQVSRIISFYPGQVITPEFDGNQTITSLLAQSRSTKLTVHILFAKHDSLISGDDRIRIIQSLSANPQIHAYHYLFEAGHAFMNNHRNTFNESAAREAWGLLDAQLY